MIIIDFAIWLTRGLSKCVFGPWTVYARILIGFPDVDFRKFSKLAKLDKNNFKKLPKISELLQRFPKIFRKFSKIQKFIRNSF